MRDLEPVWAGTYRDTLTGFEGVANARTEYRFGLPQICLVDLDGTGATREAWFHEGRLERVGLESKPSTPGFGS